MEREVEVWWRGGGVVERWRCSGCVGGIEVEVWWRWRCSQGDPGLLCSFW